MTGAFSAGRPPGQPQDEARMRPDPLIEKMSQVVGGTSRPGILPGSATARPTNPESVRSNSLSAMDRLKSMVTARAVGQDRMSSRPTPEIGVAPKGEFVLGQKPRPTGPTAHEIMTHPAHQAVLKEVIKEHEATNPGRALKAPHLVSLWNAKNPSKPLNEARARTVVAKVNKAKESYVQKQIKAAVSKPKV
jgi:hypothetical protein